MSHMLPQIGTKCFFSAEEKLKCFKYLPLPIYMFGDYR